MEENNKKEQETRYLTQEKQLGQIRAFRQLFRAKIKEFMEEETGETYQMEDDFVAIFNALSPTQRQNINGKITLFEKFSSQQ